MILPKYKLSIISNILYLLVASSICLLVFYDVSEKYGFSPLFSLIAFGVVSLVGLLIFKLLSFTSGLDFLKSFSDKGKYISVVIFTFLMIASIAFRVLTYLWSGLGGNAFFEIAKVTGEAVPHYVHPADEFYVQLLHSVFFLFGNRIYVAAITNCALQIIAVVFGFVAFRKLLGNVPALVFGVFWTVSGLSVHEALTLNSRTIIFFLFMITVFAISFAVPAKEGKVIPCIISGILISLCIYVDITGFVLIPFLLGMMLYIKGNEGCELSLRAVKTLLTLISSVFGFVLIIILDGVISSSNPLHIVSAIFSRYFPPENFSLGFSYMTSYTEIFIMAVIVTLGLLVNFFTDDDTKLVLILSTIIIVLINNFGLTYLENDGRCLLFTFCALFTGLSLRELFPAEFTGDIFKASAQIDNDISYPDEGYVPTGLSADEMVDFGDDLDDIPAQAPAAPVAQTPAPSAPSHEETKNEQKNDYYDLASFDAVNIKRPGQNAPAQNVSNQNTAANNVPSQNVVGQNLSQSANEVKAAGDGLPSTVGSSLSQEKKKEEPAKETPKPGEYVYRKPQLKPEYRRRPGAWINQVNSKGKNPDATGAALGAVNSSADNADTVNKDASAYKNDHSANADNLNSVNKENASPKENAPRVDENGVVLLDNPIPHPERKTDHKPMEFENKVSDSQMDYDIAVSDDDDFDV